MDQFSVKKKKKKTSTLNKLKAGFIRTDGAKSQ